MGNIKNKVDNLDCFVRSYRTQILPNDHQKKLMKQWFHDSVCVYNKLVSHFTQIYNKHQLTVSKMIFDNKYKKIKKFAELLSHEKNFPLNFQDMRKLKIPEYTEDYH